MFVETWDISACITILRITNLILCSIKSQFISVYGDYSSHRQKSFLSL